jgi:hypothetical protein
VSQPVLPLLARTRSVDPWAGLVGCPDGGVVFVLGLATFGYASADQAGGWIRRSLSTPAEN